jgi:hypothetical protein
VEIQDKTESDPAKKYASTNEAQKDWEEAQARFDRFICRLKYSWRQTKAHDVVLILVTTAGVIAAGIVAYIYYEQLITMQRQLTASDRPWVYADVEPVFNETLVSGRLVIPLQFSLRNVGHSPASRVRIAGAIVNFTGNETPEMVQRRTCEEAQSDRVVTPMPTGVVVFPGQSPAPIRIAFNVERRSDAFVDLEVPVITGCIDYRDSTSGEHHQTGFAYQALVSPNVKGAIAGFSTISLVQFDPLTGYNFSFAN